MGVLNATTIRALQDYSEMSEVHGKHPSKLQAYIDRAEAIISHLYSPDVSLAGCADNLQLAVNMLAENLIILNTPTFKRSQLAGFRSETIGSYSYTRGTNAEVVFDPVTEEIRMLLGACLPNSGGIQYSRTHVFVPRTFRVVGGGEEEFYYLPEDERVTSLALIDPSDPRHR